MLGGAGAKAPASGPVFTLLPVCEKVLDAVREMTESTEITIRAAAMPLAATAKRLYRSAGLRCAFEIALRNAQWSCSDRTGEGSARISATVARNPRRVAEQSEQPVRCCSRSSRSVPV